MLTQAQSEAFFEAQALERVRLLSVVIILMSLLEFIFGWFAYGVGVLAAIVTGFAALVAYHRCESVHLIVTGVHPCGAMLCFCCVGPRGELYGVQMSMFVALFIMLAAVITSIVTAVTMDIEPWLQTIRIINSVIAVLLMLLQLLFLGAFRHVIVIHERYCTADLTISSGPPRMQYNRGNFALYEDPRFESIPPITAAPGRQREVSRPREPMRSEPFSSPQPLPPTAVRVPAVQPSAAYQYHGRPPRFSSLGRNDPYY